MKHHDQRGSVAPRCGSTHKRRSVWYRQTSAWPYRDANAETLETAFESANRPTPAAQPPTWASQGPTNVAGRMTCGSVDPADPKNILFGAAGGGVWRRLNGPWEEVSEGLGSLNIGSLALDPADPDIVYCGTGEANLTADSHPGVGLYRRRGWLSAAWAGPWERIASPKHDGIPRRIGAIAVDPERPGHLLIGGVDHRSELRDEAGGLYRRASGRGRFRRVALGGVDAPYWCHDVQFRPEDPRVIFCTVSERGERGGLWRSTDRGVHWEPVGRGLPDRELWGRSRFAISPFSPETMYVLIAALWDGVLGVFRSTDGGENWSAIGGTHFDQELQMSYNNAIAVDPENPDRVLCGGVDLHLWDGQEWCQVTSWSAESGTEESVHADHHAILWPARDHIWNANDGGVAFSADGYSWASQSEGLVTTMFYDFAVAKTDAAGGVFGGGTQDNGTLVSRTGPGGFKDVTGGDGGWMAFDPTDHNVYFTTTQYVAVYRHEVFPPDEYRTDVTPAEDEAISNSVWMAPLVIHPGRPKTVFLGTTRVWWGRPFPLDEVVWEPLSPVFDGSPITALEIAPSNLSYVYGGTQNGGIFVSCDRGGSWSGDLSSRVLPGAIITRLRAHPQDPKRVLAIVGRMGHGHVFRSDNGGRTWRDVSGPLPDVPFRALAAGGTRDDDVYAGSDAGLFLSRDFGDTWYDFSGDLPRSTIWDLAIHQPSGNLYVATYGRGIFRSPLAP